MQSTIVGIFEPTYFQSCQEELSMKLPAYHLTVWRFAWCRSLFMERTIRTGMWVKGVRVPLNPISGLAASIPVPQGISYSE